MISNQILQNTIEGLKSITRVELCITDTDGRALAATFKETDNFGNIVTAFVESEADSQVIQGSQFFKIFDEQNLEYLQF